MARLQHCGWRTRRRR